MWLSANTFPSSKLCINSVQVFCVVQSKKEQAADQMVKAGVKLEQKKGAMGGKMDGVIDKAEQALAKAHNKLMDSDSKK